MKTVNFVELMKIFREEKLTWVNLTNKIPTVNGYGRNSRCYMWHGLYGDVFTVLKNNREDKILVEISSKYKNERIKQLSEAGYVFTAACELLDNQGYSCFDKTYYIAEKESI